MLCQHLVLEMLCIWRSTVTLVFPVNGCLFLQTTELNDVKVVSKETHAMKVTLIVSNLLLLLLLDFLYYFIIKLVCTVFGGSKCKQWFYVVWIIKIVDIKISKFLALYFNKMLERKTFWSQLSFFLQNALPANGDLTV